jgi:hypothetical protein
MAQIPKRLTYEIVCYSDMTNDEIAELVRREQDRLMGRAGEPAERKELPMPHHYKIATLCFRSGAQATYRFDEATLTALLETWKEVHESGARVGRICNYDVRDFANYDPIRLLLDITAIEAVTLNAD